PQSGIIDHLSVGAENRAVLTPQFIADRFFVFVRFRGGGGQGATKPLQFPLLLIRFNETLGNAKPLGVKNQSRTNGHPWRDRNSPFDFHKLTPLPHKEEEIQGASSSADGAARICDKASPAGTASLPETSKRSSVPCSAASIINSSGLLPLTRWS